MKEKKREREKENIKSIFIFFSKHFPHLIGVATLEQILPFAAACSQGHLSIIKLLLTYPNYPFSICNLYVDRLQRSYVFPFNLNGKIDYIRTVFFLLKYKICLFFQHKI